MFEWSGSSWQQFGKDIAGEAARDLSGVEVSLAADGNRLAIGAMANAGNGYRAGQARVFSVPPASNNSLIFHGLFADPSNLGHGFDFNVHNGGFTVYYYGHTVSGERLWLVSDSYAAELKLDVPIELKMYEVAMGVFGYPVLPVNPWGTITIILQGCGFGHASFSGIDGNLEMDFVRRTGLPGIECRHNTR